MGLSPGGEADPAWRQACYGQRTAADCMIRGTKDRPLCFTGERNMGLKELTAVELGEKIAAKEVKVREALDAVADRIARAR